MRTISQDLFIERMSEALPELISSIMREDTSAVAKGQVSVPQFWALHYIAQKEGLTVNELATALHRGKSSTSGLLQRLEKSSLVKRSHSKSDRRVVHITLTEKGRRVVEQLVENRKQGIRKTYSSLTAPERTRHIRMIEKILKAVRTTLSAILLLSSLSAQVGFAQRRALEQSGKIILQSEIMTEGNGSHTKVSGNPLGDLAALRETRIYSLDEAVRIGLKRSLRVVNAARQREISKATKKRALAKAWPQVSGIASYTRNFPEEIGGLENFAGRESRSLGAEATWQIFSGGRTVSAIRAAKAYKQLTAHQEQRIRETQVRDIALGYYQVQLAKAKLKVRAQSVRQLTDFEAETHKKYDAGAVSEFDWLSAKVSLANEKPRLITAENELALATEQFRNLTYIDAEDLALSDPLEFVPGKIGLDEAVGLGLRKRPELLEKNSSIKLRREDINQQKSAYYPKLDLFAGYRYENPSAFEFITGQEGWQDSWNAGARSTWDLFDGGRRRSDVAESKLKMAIAEDGLRDMERSVSLDIRTQWLRSRDAAEVIEATTENVNLAKRALDIARARFDAGLSTNLEVTQANLELSDARLARSHALYEHMAAIVSMKHAAGILLEEYEQ